MTPNITLDQASHRYWDHSFQEEYTSWSRVMQFFQEKFDESGQITAAVARRDGKSVDTVKSEWKAKGDVAREHGTRIHNALELYSKTTLIEDKELEPLVRSVGNLFLPYAKTMNEVIFYSEKHKIAGTCDKPCYRDKGANPVLDIFDYKTNISKGIQYFSKYKKYLKYPLQHLEDCNYNTYSLQASAYLYMAEMTYKVKPGRLGIIYFPPNNLLGYTLIPVPYMRMEVEMMFNYYSAQNGFTGLKNGFMTKQEVPAEYAGVISEIKNEKMFAED